MIDDVTDENLWGEIDINNWKETPHIKDRIATEQDVINGFAVFYIGESADVHVPLNVEIPSLAFQKNNNTDENALVVVIQGERVEDDQVVGFRYLNGGNGICTLSELIFPDVDL